MWGNRHSRLLATIGVVVAVVGGVLGGTVDASARAPVRVVASFYPLAWAAKVVGGSHLRVADLTPSGAEPHDLELNTDDRAAIDRADLLVILGGGFQPAVEDAANQRDGPTLEIVKTLTARDRKHAERDPHVWLDPVRMQGIVDQVARRLIDVDRANAAGYRRAAASADVRLRALDADYRTGLASCQRTLLVTAHEAFGWLAKRYRLVQQGIAGIDPEQEPDPQRLAQLADLARRKGVTTVFTESLVSPKVAQTLAREAGGLKTEVLSPLESLSSEERARGDDYVTVMRANLKKLRTALGCR
jgi:zinc transport system substrate-binding protein